MDGNRNRSDKFQTVSLHLQFSILCRCRWCAISFLLLPLSSRLGISPLLSLRLGSHPPPWGSPRMLPASHPLLYACVFRDTHLLADLHSDSPDDGGIPALAAALVAGAPPHHRHLTHSSAGRAHALLLSPPLALAAVSRDPDLPAAQLLLFLRRLRCLPEDRMRDEMPRIAMRLPLPLGDDDALAREARDVAAAEAQVEEDARRDAELAAARTTPKRRGHNARRRMASSSTSTSSWRRHLWMVILADLLLLAILFAAWLAVCRGFSCIGQ